MINFGPMADRDFVNEVEDSEDGFGFEGEAGAALEFRLSPRFSIFAGGSARYLSDVGAIFNPNSGDQVFIDGLTTTLQTEDLWSYQGKAGIVLRFGGRYAKKARGSYLPEPALFKARQIQHIPN